LLHLFDEFYGVALEVGKRLDIPTNVEHRFNPYLICIKFAFNLMLANLFTCGKTESRNLDKQLSYSQYFAAIAYTDI